MLRMICTLALSVTSMSAHAADWPEFRGPKTDGHYVGPALPDDFGLEKNLIWNRPLEGLAWSSPIYWKAKLYLTNAVPDKDGNVSLRALAIDAASGKVDWDIEVFSQDAKSAPRIHPKNSHASPTPITEGERVYVHFGHLGTAALDFNGKILWKNEKHSFRPQHGNGGSPALVDDLIIFTADGSDTQNIIALNKITGENAWKTPRKTTPKMGFSFGTPIIMSGEKGKVVVTPASDIIAGYDVKTGKEIWRCNYPGGYSLIPRPLVGYGLLYFATGYNTPSVHALKLEGEGDITSKIQWSIKKDAPHTPSMLLVDEMIFMFSDRGIATCAEAKTGKVLWSERLKSPFSSSPLYDESSKLIYQPGEDGTIYIFPATSTYQEPKLIKLGEKTFACPIGVDGNLYIRTEKRLLKFGSPQKVNSSSSATGVQ
jgi:outer membrane protein assembly factor BamB